MVASPRCASPARRRSPASFHTGFAVRCGRQGRAPQPSGACRRLHQIIPPAKTSKGFSREFLSAISGFRSLCGRKQRSSQPSRSSGPAFWNLSLRAGSRLRTLASTRSLYGASNPGSMSYPERSRSRGIFQVVFSHYNQALWGQFSACDRPRDTRQIRPGRPLRG